MKHATQEKESIDTLRTCLSRIDGNAGELFILNAALDQLVETHTYTELAAKLWSVYPSVKGADTHFLIHQDKAFHKLRSLRHRLPEHSAISALRLGLEYAQPTAPAEIAMTLMMALLLHLNPEAQLTALSENCPEESVVSRFLTALQSSNTPDTFLYAKSRALSIYLMAVSDHGLNASTYTARVIASTESDLRACVQGALGALQGALHGGAPGPVLDMLDTLAKVPDIKLWVQNKLLNQERIMGFGHRIYRVRDPRADVLKKALRALQGAGFEHKRLVQAEHAETLILECLQQHKPDRVLETNVEYYTALLLEALGFPRSCFTAVFALGRVLGWCAHAREQQAIGRLIRPRATYF